MEHEFCIVLTTTDCDTTKNRLIESLLSKQLAACIQTLPIESHYVWEGTVCHDDEVLIIIKTHKSHYIELSKVIENEHNYDVPQIVQVPIVDGFNLYLTWIKNTTNL